MADPFPIVRPPTDERIKGCAAEFGIDLSDEEAQLFGTIASDQLGNYELIEGLREPAIPNDYTDRDPGGPPDDGTDPCNAFITRCSVRGSEGGPLEGYRIGLKDNIALAGVRMTCGSRLLRGYTPRTDATVVRRLLDAGGDVVGKLNLPAFSLSATGEFSDWGDGLNPRDTAYLTGGSSSGPAAAVVNGDVDIAIGTDGGASIRLPASWCGCVGLQPSHSLVPCTGVVGTGPTFDHVGPLAMTVEDCALALEVIAGQDPLDPRQGGVETQQYTAGLDHAPEAFEIGVLNEGFDWESGDERVDGTVAAALDEFEAAGAVASDVSVPMHRTGSIIRDVIAEGETTALFRDEGLGHFVAGHYDTDFLEAFGKARRLQADDFPPLLKYRLTMGQYLSEDYFGYYHAKAQNLRRKLRGAYDSVLADVDVLAMPTVPVTALEVEDELTTTEAVLRTTSVESLNANTGPFSITGHPAISVPCGTIDGLPVGLMLVGSRFDDATVLKVASAFQRAVDTTVE